VRNWAATAIARTIRISSVLPRRIQGDVGCCGLPRLVKASHLSCASCYRSYKWNGVAVACDGSLYCATQERGCLLAIRPATYDLDYISLPEGFETAYFMGIVAGPDGKVYLVLVDEFGLDPSTEQICRAAGCPVWHPGSGLSPHFVFVMTYDPEVKSFSNIVLTVPASCHGWDCAGGDVYYCFAFARNDKMYCPPVSGHTVAVIDPEQRSLSFISGADCVCVCARGLHIHMYIILI